MKTWHLFLGMSFVTMSVTYGIQTLFFTDSLMQQTFGEQLAQDRITDLFLLSRKWQWLGYTMIPLIILIRASYTTLWLYTGFYLYDLQVPLGAAIRIAIIADLAFVLSGFVKLLILIFFRQVGTLTDLQFQPFSLPELLDRDTIAALFTYPLSLINLFELIYLGWLIVLTKRTLEFHYPQKVTGIAMPAKLVLLFYGSGLLLWTLLVMFTTLHLA